MKTSVLLQTRTESRPAIRHILFLCLCLVIAAAGRHSIHEWLEMSRIVGQSSDLWIIPTISAFLIYERRSVVFAKTQFAPAGLVLLAMGFGIYAASVSARLALVGSDATVLAMLGLLVAVAGAFLACYGSDAGHRARFPLGFLLFAVPIPQAILTPLIRWLQWGSAAIVNLLFQWLSVPHLRDGLTFYLTGLSIEIAPDCSGIRSSFALLVLTVLLCYMVLHSTWRRIVMILAVVPLVLVKNGIRIVTLSLLAIYVDPSFINGALHRHGGYVFFALVLVVEGALCWLLQRSERRMQVSSH